MPQKKRSNAYKQQSDQRSTDAGIARREVDRAKGEGRPAQEQFGSIIGSLINRFRAAEWWMVALTIGILTLTFLMWETMENSNAMLRKNIEATQRPWLKVESAFVTEPLNFKRNTPLEITIKLKVKNHGNGVANFVNGQAFVSPLTDDGAKHLIRIAAEQEQFCESIISESSFNLTDGTVFPSETVDVYAYMRIPLSDVPEKFRPRPAVVGCVTYVSAFSERPHQTGFAFSVGISQHMLGAIDTTRSIPAKAVTLEELPFGDYAR